MSIKEQPEEYAKAYVPGKEEMPADIGLLILCIDEFLDDLHPIKHHNVYLKYKKQLESELASTKQSNEPDMFMAGGNTQSEKDFYQLGYSAAMQKMQSTASNEDDINPETGKEYFSTLTPEKFSKHLGDKAVQQAAKEYMLRSEGSQLVYEAFLAGASFNSDAVEFAEWIGKEDLKLYAEGWCQPGGSNGFHYTTQELYILFRSDKNKIQQAHDKAQYE